MLGEIGDVHVVDALEASAGGFEPAGDQLGEGRLAVAVGAEEGDAVVVVDPEAEPVEHRPPRRIANARVLHLHDRRGQPLRRIGEGEGRDGLVRDRGDRLEP